MASAGTITGRVVRVAVLLLCAFIAQWLAAWGFVIAARGSTSMSPMKTVDEVPRAVLADWEEEFADGGGRTLYARTFDEAQATRDTSIGRSSRVGSQVFVIQGYLMQQPGYTCWGLQDGARSTVVGMAATWAGWPMSSLKMRHSTVGGVTTTYVACVRFGVIEGWVSAPGPCMLPTRVLWPGAIVNTLVYACVWLVLLRGWREAWRWRRRSKGRCPECGYELRTAAHETIVRCPECGVQSVMRLPRREGGASSRID